MVLIRPVNFIALEKAEQRGGGLCLYIHRTLHELLWLKTFKNKKKQKYFTTVGVEPTTSTTTDNHHRSAPRAPWRCVQCTVLENPSPPLLCLLLLAHISSSAFMAQPKMCCPAPKTRIHVLKFGRQVYMGEKTNILKNQPNRRQKASSGPKFSFIYLRAHKS